MSRRIVILTKNAPQPMGPWYVQAVRDGDTLYISGVLGVQLETGQLMDGAANQVARIMIHLTNILMASGSGLNQVNKATVYLIDMADAEHVNRTFVEVFGAHVPARSMVAVQKLPLSALVEIEVIAHCTNPPDARCIVQS